MLKNLKLLKDEMKNKGWTICSFIFSYKNTRYIVLVKRFVVNEIRNDKYALIKLQFMKESDLNDSLEIEANSNKLIADAQMLREYFGINYSNNIGDILKQFTLQFGNSISTEVKDTISELEKKAMVHSLSLSDSEDPEKIYCTKVRRNPQGHKRSEFNTDKTKLLRRSLFEHFKDDDSISFCYSKEKNDEKDDVTILKNFSIQ